MSHRESSPGVRPSRAWAGPALAAAALFGALVGCGTPPSRGPWLERFPGADSVRVEVLEPGVAHGYLWFGRGPWAIHVLEIDAGVCGPVVAAVKAGPPLGVRATTSELAGNGIAGINADFFLIPAGTPVGAAVHVGRVLAGPATRPVFGIDASGDPVAGVARLDGWIATRDDTAIIAGVNRTGSDTHHRERAGVVYLDEWHGAAVPDTGVTVHVRRAGAADGVNGGSRGLVVGDGTGEVVLRGVGPRAREWLSRRAPGDTVRWEIGVAVDGDPLAEAVGAFPILVVDGVGVYAEQPGVRESFGDARHPRTAVGWDDEGRWFWVVVDGRQAPYSDGMTLTELEGLFLGLGATNAINLDGGGSSAIVIRGTVVNRPSDDDGERPVGNALVLDRCGGPAGG